MPMKLLAVDDETLALNGLLRCLREAAPGCNACGFTDPYEALEEVEQGRFLPEAAFLDIEMCGMNGLELAKRLREASHSTKIIFVTGYSQYALEAFSLHARGYLLKPVTADRVRAELDELQDAPAGGAAHVRVQAFGNFEVYVAGKRLEFRRSKAKELFAYLVHKRGSSCTTRELAAVLFEDRQYNTKLLNYLQTIISSMIKTFQEADAKDVVVRRFNRLCINPDAFSCDYYRFLNWETEAINAYTGEFMAQYEWAEFVIPYLESKVPLEKTHMRDGSAAL